MHKGIRHGIVFGQWDGSERAVPMPDAQEARRLYWFTRSGMADDSVRTLELVEDGAVAHSWESPWTDAQPVPAPRERRGWLARLFG